TPKLKYSIYLCPPPHLCSMPLRRTRMTRRVNLASQVHGPGATATQCSCCTSTSAYSVTA
ncbi:hypothetical protein JYU34_022928, partial [Plutella xylostella]